jgi:DNA-directed RNA polymerase III subunit RPC4
MVVDEAGVSADVSLHHRESQNKSSRRKGLSTKDKDPKLASETIEERAERLRHAEDVRKIRHELVALPPPVPATGDVEMEEQDRLDAETTSGREDRMYLFQFPPLTPMLVDPAHKDDVVEIKQEPGVDGIKADGAIGTAAAPAAESSTKSKDKEKEKPPHIKKEDHDSKEDVKAHIAAAAERAKMLTADGARLPSGFAGKLNVHKSGKVTLEWGETNMEVRWGSEVDFLQDVVLAAGDQGEEQGAAEARSAFALGQVQKKLVVIPDWQKIYE